MLESCEPATPYDLKQAAREGLVKLWALPHTQIYTECSRLAEGGYVSEKREETGRRRRVYRLTAKGREALDAWRADPRGHLWELRDLGLLKLFFGGDPKALAAEQLAAHSARLEFYEQVTANVGEDCLPEGMRLALEAGVGHEREWIRFWSKLAESKRSPKQAKQRRVAAA